MASPPRVGGEIDAVCTRCKMLLGHTILAMVGSRVARVRCNTCQGEHNYHAAGGASRAPRERGTAPPRPAARAAAVAAGQDLDERLKGKDISRAERYQVGAVFAEGAVVDHPAFGLGVVLSIRGEKMDVQFRAGVKTLAQHRGGAAGPKRLPGTGSAQAEAEEPSPAGQPS
ncbi:MAG: hypothetical protein ACYDCL_12145 [Myxococcales bacterium]